MLLTALPRTRERVNYHKPYQFSSVQFSSVSQFSCSLLRARRATKAALRVGVPDLNTLSGNAAEGADVHRTAARARSGSIIINPISSVQFSSVSQFSSVVPYYVVSEQLKLPYV